MDKAIVTGVTVFGKEMMAMAMTAMTAALITINNLIALFNINNSNITQFELQWINDQGIAVKKHNYICIYNSVSSDGASTGIINLNTFTAIVDLSRSNFSIARAPLFQLKSAT